MPSNGQNRASMTLGRELRSFLKKKGIIISANDDEIEALLPFELQSETSTLSNLVRLFDFKSKQTINFM